MKKRPEFYNKGMETISEKELMKVQEKKLRRQIAYVYRNSRFYKEKLEEAGVKPSQIKTLNDLEKFPFTHKDELRKSQEAMLPLGRHAAVPLDKVVRIHSSSGTTGRPTYVGITKRDKQVWIEIVARCLYAEGVRPGDRMVHAMGLSFFVGGLPIHNAAEEIGATFIPIGTGASDRALSAIQDIRANIMHCTPSYSIYFSEYVRSKYNLEPRSLRLERIISGAEPGAGVPSIRKKIEDEWGVDLREGMGNADVCPIVFGECFARHGMHFCAQEFIMPELIDPNTGESVEMIEGAQGELVYTHIDRECVPLLRFRSRDHVIVWTDQCACGRTSFRLRCIGRTDDMLKIRGVTVFPSAIRDVVMAMRPRTTGEVQILLESPGPVVEPPLKISVEYSRDFKGNLDELSKEITEELRSKLIFSADVTLVPEGSLPRYEMKAALIKKNF